jgi:hypothetical protein
VRIQRRIASIPSLCLFICWPRHGRQAVAAARQCGVRGGVERSQGLRSLPFSFAARSYAVLLSDEAEGHREGRGEQKRRVGDREGWESGGDSDSEQPPVPAHTLREHSDAACSAMQMCSSGSNAHIRSACTQRRKAPPLLCQGAMLRCCDGQQRR